MVPSGGHEGRICGRPLSWACGRLHSVSSHRLSAVCVWILISSFKKKTLFIIYLAVSGLGFRAGAPRALPGCGTRALLPEACGILVSGAGTKPAPPAVEGRGLTTRPPGCGGGSVAQSRPTLCDPMDCSTPGFPVLHCLPEFTQTRVRRVSDAIQPPGESLTSSCIQTATRSNQSLILN